MGGDSFSSSSPLSEDASLSGQDYPNESINSSVPSGDVEGLSRELANGSVINGVNFLNSDKFVGVSHRVSSTVDEAAERQRLKVYAEVLSTYKASQSRIDSLEAAKTKILSYIPGSWADKAGGLHFREYSVPSVTSLLLIGPKGSGKSSLVNKISFALEDDLPLSGRAQVSYNSSAGDGTCFLREYMIPRGPDSGQGIFCLYDTRSLSVDSSENLKMLEHWMTRGVRDGELIRRKSDSMTLNDRLNYKARRCLFSSRVRPVDFVIFVVNGLSVLESMDSVDQSKKQYSQMIAENFNNPLLSFKDDKPVVVVTHGDLLPLPDRVRVRVYLGELLGVPPVRQIFDIPENNDPVTTLAITDMLIYCLERADINFPAREPFWEEVFAIGSLLFMIAMAIALIFGIRGLSFHDLLASLFPSPRVVDSSPIVVDWMKIRHLWLG